MMLSLKTARHMVGYVQFTDILGANKVIFKSILNYQECI